MNMPRHIIAKPIHVDKETGELSVSIETHAAGFIKSLLGALNSRSLGVWQQTPRGAAAESTFQKAFGYGL
jgi:hypothetical protein